jgi:ketosteroid isomerase-like protein
MPTDIELLERTYDRFNARDIDAVLAMLHPAVVWANGWEGGYVHGHDGVRDYWTRQWAVIDSRVTPVGFTRRPDGRVAVEVHQTARDLEGNLLSDRTTVHLFRLEDGRITRFDIE